jgi:hemerythrin-like domain-containing protein
MEDKAVPKTGWPLAALRAEHDKGRKLVTTLKEAAEAYPAGRLEAAEEISNAIGGIRQLYPTHIWKEDEMVFPMAKRLFTVDELKQLITDFDKAERDFGQDHDQYIAFANEMELLLGR